MIALLRWLIRGSKHEPAQRLTRRSPQLHQAIVAAHKAEHDTFAQRHDWDAMLAKHAAAAAQPQPRIDYLAPYWPKDIPRPVRV